MMWVCRVGKQGKLFDTVKETSELFISWEGYNFDFSKMDKVDIRNIVAEESQTDNTTTISNYTAMLIDFVSEMQIGEYVIIPGNKEYNVVMVEGDYEYRPSGKFHHFRRIKVVKEHLSKDMFNQTTNYSLGAFRTVFKVKDEESVLKVINREMNNG